MAPKANRSVFAAALPSEAERRRSPRVLIEEGTPNVISLIDQGQISLLINTASPKNRLSGNNGFGLRRRASEQDERPRAEQVGLVRKLGRAQLGSTRGEVPGVPLGLRWSTVGWSLAAASASGLVAGWYPARRAVRIDVVAALRQD